MPHSYTKVKVGDNQYVSGHRHVMEQHLGRKLREDELVHHKDGNRRNNNIENLELMTREQHTKEHLKDRLPFLPRGEKHTSAKLNDEKVREIKKLLLKGFSYPKLAKMFNVDGKSIYNIKKGINWKHVTI